MHSLRYLAVALLCACASGVWGTAWAEVRTFENPTYHGAPVAYCNLSGDLCGEEIARRWCINEGFEAVNSWMLSDVAGAGIARETGAQRGFTHITCSRRSDDFNAPALDSYARITAFSPDRASIQSTFAPVRYYLTVPGCHQSEPGVFMCETVHDYQHCRTLYRSGKVFGCKAGVAFSSQFATPTSADPSSYDLDVESTAIATVQYGQRGHGRLRGEAKFNLAFSESPVPADKFCIQRDRYVYHSTGPMGGMSGIEEAAPCDQAIAGSFEPNEDDLIRAYDLCNGQDAWGGSVEQSIDLLVAGLYHVADAGVVDRAWLSADDIDVLAPYVTVRAPMTVRCRR